MYHETRAIIANHFCNRLCKGIFQKRVRPVTKEWLQARYIDDNLGAPEIAAIVNRDAKSVWNWLKDFGIQTRPRGADERQHFKHGHTLCVGRGHTPEGKAKLRAARKADGHFPKQANGRPYWEGKTGTIHPSWKGGLTPERQAMVSSGEWRDAVRSVWMRAAAKCERCGLDSRTIKWNKRAFHVHHIVSFQIRESRCNPDNLALLCRECHLFVHSRQNAAGEYIGEIRDDG